jgi:hypothetical protein
MTDLINFGGIALPDGDCPWRHYAMKRGLVEAL